MSRYSTYGTLDDRVAQNADVGFSGFNNRLRPDQLNAGVLSDAKNLRMDRNGSAQVRKGVDIVQNPLAVGVSALTLDFTLVADDTDAAIADPDSNSGNLVITNITGSSYPSSGTINLSNVSGITGANANHSYTKTGTNELTVSGDFTGSADASVTVKFGILADGSVNNIYGSMHFSDRRASSSQYIIIASNGKAIGIDIANNFTFDIGYPSLITIAENVEMLQALKTFIFRAGNTALQNDLRISTISAASLDSNAVTVTTSSAHNLESGEQVTISNLTGSDLDPSPNGSFQISGLGAADGSDTATKFRFALTGGNTTFTVTSNPVVATDFTKVTSGTYTQPTELEATGFVITNGLATATVSNTLSAGDKVVLTVAGGITSI